VRFALYTCYFFAATTGMFIIARIIKRDRALRRSVLLSVGFEEFLMCCTPACVLSHLPLLDS
jgi:hypothetical protein